MMVDRTASDPEPLTYIIPAGGIQKNMGTSMSDLMFVVLICFRSFVLYPLVIQHSHGIDGPFKIIMS